MDSQGLPLHAYDLIDELAELYPEIIYDPHTDREEFLLRSGERRLVRTLLERRRIEQEKD